MGQNDKNQTKSKTEIRLHGMGGQQIQFAGVPGVTSGKKGIPPTASRDLALQKLTPFPQYWIFLSGTVAPQSIAGYKGQCPNMKTHHPSSAGTASSYPSLYFWICVPTIVFLFSSSIYLVTFTALPYRGQIYTFGSGSIVQLICWPA